MSLAGMGRWVRRGVVVACLVVLANAEAGPLTVQLSSGAAAGVEREAAIGAAAQVSWPPSNGMLVSEVVTRSAGSADQYVELYNASAASADLGGLELVYVTASGLTVTRKQTWTALAVPAHAHVLIANASGIYAGVADGLFSNGGFSTSGGALVLRTVSGGNVVDALAWGTATNTFVEGSPATAPPTGSSVERKPGGILGNATDSNDNLADTRLEPAPTPQNLAAAPVPGPTPTPTTVVTPTASASATATALASDTPTVEPTDTATPLPTDPPTPEPTAFSTPEPTPTPDPTATPTLEPTPLPTADPTAVASPTPAPLTVGAARALPLGTFVTMAGVLTTPVGLTESGRGAFVQDETGGMALYLSAGDWPLIAPGTSLVLTGSLETRYSLLTLRLADASAITQIGPGTMPDPVSTGTGGVNESLEAQLVSITGTVSDAISTLTDGFSTAIDDGSGALRVIVATQTGITPDQLSRGSVVGLVGVVGQRDTSGTGLAGYRLHLRSATDLTPVATPSPSPIVTPSSTPSTTPIATPTAAPTPASTESVAPSPTPTAQPTPTPSPTPTSSLAILTIAQVRQLAVGSNATVQGVVTVEPGRLPDPSVIAIQDGTGGICVNLPADASAALTRGMLITVSGVVAAPYGNLELRPATGADVVTEGSGEVPVAQSLTAAQLGESTEGILAKVSGTLAQIDSTTTSVTLFIDDGMGQARIFMTAALGIARTEFELGSQLQVSGIVADRLGLYRMWPRDRSDITVTAIPTPSPAPTSSPGPTATAAPTPTPVATSTPPPAPEVMAIAGALNHPGETVAIQGTITSQPGLLDADSRRVTVEDGSAAVLARLPDQTTVHVGQRLLLIGAVGTYYGAPQFAVSDTPVALGGGPAITPLAVKTPKLAASLEWRLISVTGNVTSVSRDGDSWRAELAFGGGSLPIDGLARSGILSTALAVGRTATVVGIVKRPYPTASDQRMAIVPRTAADITLTGTAPKPTPTTRGAPGATSALPAGPRFTPGGFVGGGPDALPGAALGSTPAQAIALADLASHEGVLVLVGGRIEAIDGDRLLLNDGSSVGAIRLESNVGAPSFATGELVNARGIVTRTEQGGLEVVVDDATSIRALDPVLARADAPLGSSVAATEPASDSAPPSPAGPNQLGFALLGVLALAGMVGTAGVAVARRPQVLHAVRLAIANMRTRE